MKMTIILMIVFTLNLSATGFGQISLSEKGKSVKEVLRILEKETSYRFFYNDDLKSIDKMVDIEVQNGNINQVLEKLFESTEFDYKVLENNLIVITLKSTQIQSTISGKVTDAASREGLPGVSIVVKGTSNGVNSDLNGNYTITVADPNATLVFSFIGYKQEEVVLVGKAIVNVQLSLDVTALSEVVVIGYGTQKRSDITGTVASLPKDKLEMTPNLNIAQAIQGSIAGVMIQTTSSGAASEESIMIRGRNSIAASNNPLIVLDGIPYGGQIRDINPNNVESIEILKDASSAAIYGSRASSGVILITTKQGVSGKLKVSYDGKYSIQSFANLPDLMTGPEYYDFKMIRYPGAMTQSEKDMYESGKWTNWMDLAFRKGSSQKHDLSVSGGSENTTYFLSFGLLDVKGLALNDNYRNYTTRINIDAKISDWLSIGTRTQLGYDDRSGESPDMNDVFTMEPLIGAFNDDGSQRIKPWPEDPYFGNPLQPLLFDNINKSYQILTNNFVKINFPFIPGLAYNLNTGIRMNLTDNATYKGRDTKEGLDVRGSSETAREIFNNTVIDNILTYKKDFGDHSIFATALYSYEGNKNSANSLIANRFPNDFLSYFAASQAEYLLPEYTYDQTDLISQMLRLNYGYKSKYLLTLTSRRDGFSGFGADTKWGIFPSVAIGWNLDKENFFPWKEIFNEFKLRASYGLNGKQAAGPYSSISSLSIYNIVDRKTTFPGYIPSRLGQANLGWESSKTLNIGLDFGILKNRISGNINIYKTNTSNLLLERSISAVHGINSIIQNIGETQNNGIEISFTSSNIVNGDFKWSTSGNIAFVQNKIVSLGQRDEEGNEIDDVANSWFIDKPIDVNYDYKWIGTWQLDETEEAAKWNSKPGFVKIMDANGDYQLTGTDRQIIGQRDPKLMWGLTNSISYKSFKLDVFVHGVQGVTKDNPYMSDYVWADVRQNTVMKNWWTPENPTNEWIINNLNADMMNGIRPGYYQDASFIRIKDITLSYDFKKSIMDRLGMSKLRIYVTGRNQFTFTKWTGLDPELSDQKSSIPLQKEILFGLSLGF
jgi:TonB-linked SusC/RagA family outer membrane protein